MGIEIKQTKKQTRKVRRERRKWWRQQRYAKNKARKKEIGGPFVWAAAILCILLGTGIFLYPMVSNYFAEREQNQVIEHYVARVEDTTKEEREQEWEEARIYNENIAGDPVHDPFMVGSGYAIPDNYNEVLDMDSSGIMCYLEIPKLDLELPVYHGTSEEVLKKGVGHLEMTALPIGGINRRAVLTGHRGLPSAELFTRLDEMQIGDGFYIHVLGEINAYKVKEIETVKPEKLQDLTIMPQGEDLITLVTCTPYGMNTHRLLVTGERTEYVPETEKEKEPESLTQRLMPWKYYLIGALIAALIIGAGICVKRVFDKKNGRGKGEPYQRRRAKRKRRNQRKGKRVQKSIKEDDLD